LGLQGGSVEQRQLALKAEEDEGEGDEQIEVWKGLEKDGVCLFVRLLQLQSFLSLVNPRQKRFSRRRRWLAQERGGCALSRNPKINARKKRMTR
jgi:hypothetical protein